MNQSNSDLLVDETSIREALRPMRPDADAFRNGVKQRIASARSSPPIATRCLRDEWLQIAAAFVPIHLLTPNLQTAITPISFAAVSTTKKMLLVFAFPFLSLFMIGFTILGMMQIRRAQLGQVQSTIDVALAQAALRRWWKRFGWIVVLVFGLSLTAPLFGWTTPLMIALIGSGMAMVSLVHCLGREHLVERSTIGGISVAVLGLLGQLSLSFGHRSTQVLDPNLVTGVLFAGAFGIAAMLPKFASGSNTQRLDAHTNVGNESIALVLFALASIVAIALLIFAQSYWLAGIVLVIIGAAGFALRGRGRFDLTRLPSAVRLLIASAVLVACSSSYWNDRSVARIRNHVEKIDKVRIVLWDDWADAAKWLSETVGDFDKDEPNQRFRRELDTNPQARSWMLTAGLRSHLISVSDLDEFTDESIDRRSFLKPELDEAPMVDIHGDYFRVIALLERDALIPEDRERLANRLMLSWRRLSSSDFDFDRLRTALLLTELFQQVAPAHALPERTRDVHRWLRDSQIMKPDLFRSGGGLAISSAVHDSNIRATLSGVGLAVVYGLPDDFDVGMLRAYLRPNALYDWVAYESVPKAIARDQLYRLANVAPPTMVDYLGTEAPLWLSIMLVLLLIYATMSSPLPFHASTPANSSPRPASGRGVGGAG